MCEGRGESKLVTRAEQGDQRRRLGRLEVGEGGRSERAEGGHGEGTRLAGPRAFPGLGQVQQLHPWLGSWRVRGERRWGEGRGRGGTCCLMPPNSALTPSSKASIEVDMRSNSIAFVAQTVDHDATAVTWHNNNKYYEHNGGARTVHINNNTRQQNPAHVC